MEASGQVHAPAALPPGRKFFRYLFVWSMSRTQSRLDAVVKRKIPVPCRESNPSHPAHSLVTIFIKEKVNL
jgi:hypothetical protein